MSKRNISTEEFKPAPKPIPRIEVEICARLSFFWCPDDFECSGQTWEDFVKLMLSDEEYAKNSVWNLILDEHAIDILKKDRVKIKVILIE